MSRRQCFAEKCLSSKRVSTSHRHGEVDRYPTIMRFRNSSDYFSLQGNLFRYEMRNSAIDAAFNALAERISGTVTTRIPDAGFSTAANSAVLICSKVTSPKR